MRDYSQIISRMTSTLWLIEENSLATMLEIVNRHLRGERLDEEEIRIRIENADHNHDGDNPRVEVGGGIGLIQLHGPIFPKANLMTEMSGATSLETLKNDMNELLQDDRVNHIIMDIDSPGGASDMISETGDFIYEARQQKPIYAVANTVACSGAYWLGTQASEFYVTDSGRVGSLGVYTVHEDISARDEAAGVKYSFVSAGKYKTAGNPHEPLTEEVKEYVQEQVDETMTTFVDAVARGRGIDSDKVRSDFADGRVFSATKATKLNMVDGVKTLDSLVGELLQEQPPAISGVLSGSMARTWSGNGTNVTMTGPVLKVSEVEMEHSEPGTGSPPIPREQEKDRIEPTRIPQPPIVLEEEASMEELITQLREAGVTLGDDASEADVVAAVVALQETVETQEAQLTPLREAQVRANRNRKFAEEYPEEAQRLRNLEETDRTNQAQAFSDNFKRFVNAETDEKRPTGFSALVLEMIRDAHVDISNREFTHEGLSDLLSQIGNGGIVDYTEMGSSRPPGERPEGKGPRQQFASLVQEMMEADNLEYDVAVKEAAKRDPELFDLYMASANSQS